MIGLTLRFGVVGVLGFLIDAIVTMTLEQVVALPAFAARPPAIAAAMLATWWVNRQFTFRVAAPITSLGPYAVVAALAALLNYALFLACIARGLGTFASILSATAVSMVLSFIGYRKFAFAGAAPAASMRSRTRSCRSARQ